MCISSIITIKSPKDESFVSVSRENSFVLWDVGIAGRDAYVRDSVVCVWSLSIVRITGKARITFPKSEIRV